MSGLLAEDDGGKTDLGTLEKRLADKAAAQGSARNSVSSPGTPSGRRDDSTSAHPTPQMASVSTPQTDAPGTPSNGQAKRKQNEKEVEALADQMCSLVTNNIGETRYIGWSFVFCERYGTLTTIQDRHPAFPSSHQKVSSG